MEAEPGASRQQYARALQLDKIHAIDESLLTQQKARFDADQAQVQKLEAQLPATEKQLADAEAALKSAEQEAKANPAPPAGLPAGRGVPDRSQEDLALVRADAAIKKAKAHRDTCSRSSSGSSACTSADRSAVPISRRPNTTSPWPTPEQHAAEAELSELQALRKSGRSALAPDTQHLREVAATKMARARALLAKAEATFRYRRAQLDRLTRLHEHGSVSSREVTEAKGHLAEAEADLNVVRKELEQAEAKVEAEMNGLEERGRHTPRAFGSQRILCCWSWRRIGQARFEDPGGQLGRVDLAERRG